MIKYRKHSLVPFIIMIAKLPQKTRTMISSCQQTIFSYTHFVQLLHIEDPLERAFYEIECMKGVWCTRELKRQIESNYFKRSGLSRDKDALRELASQGAVQQDLTETVKSPFVFEFLRLDAKDIVKRYCERVRVRVSPDGSPAGVHA